MKKIVIDVMPLFFSRIYRQLASSINESISEYNETAPIESFPDNIHDLPSKVLNDIIRRDIREDIEHNKIINSRSIIITTLKSINNAGGNLIFNTYFPVLNLCNFYSSDELIYSLSSKLDYGFISIPRVHCKNPMTIMDIDYYLTNEKSNALYAKLSNMKTDIKIIDIMFKFDEEGEIENEDEISDWLKDIYYEIVRINNEKCGIDGP